MERLLDPGGVLSVREITWAAAGTSCRTVVSIPHRQAKNMVSRTSLMWNKEFQFLFRKNFHNFRSVNSF